MGIYTGVYFGPWFICNDRLQGLPLSDEKGREEKTEKGTGRSQLFKAYIAVISLFYRGEINS